MNEFQLITQYFQQPTLSFSNAFIALGMGDDCAAFTIPPQYELHLSMDTLVEGVHFPKGANPFDIATRCLAVSVSDLAAMAATPIGFTLGITLPEKNPNWLKGFSEGLTHAAQYYQCPLMGGDTTKGPSLVITLQVHGVCEHGKSLKRSGAKIGDKVYVSGPLGDGAGALPIVLKEPTENTGLAKQFYSPTAQIEFAQQIKPYANSCLDISDGLIQDLNHICKASGVGMTIDPKAIPLSSELFSIYGKGKALQYALTGGDDYQLAYTAPECEFGVCIGEVVKGEQVIVHEMDVRAGGYQHF